MTQILTRLRITDGRRGLRKRPATCLHRDDTNAKFENKADHAISTYATPKHNSPGCVKSDQAAAILAKVNADNPDVLHVASPMSPIRLEERGGPFHKRGAVHSPLRPCQKSADLCLKALCLSLPLHF
jgi:hypothetical protein